MSERRECSKGNDHVVEKRNDRAYPKLPARHGARNFAERPGNEQQDE